MKEINDLFLIWYWDNKDKMGNKDFWDKDPFGKELSYYMRKIKRWKGFPRGNPKAGYSKMTNKSKNSIEDLF